VPEDARDAEAETDGTFVPTDRNVSPPTKRTTAPILSDPRIKPTKPPRTRPQ
jgi:hypothetical protein